MFKTLQSALLAIRSQNVYFVYTICNIYIYIYIYIYKTYNNIYKTYNNIYITYNNISSNIYIYIYTYANFLGISIFQSQPE